MGYSLILGLHPAIAAPTTGTISTLPGLGKAFAGHPPDNLGIHNGQLSPCPDSPNCVLSQNADEIHTIEAIPYQGDQAQAQDLLLKVLSVVPRTTIIEQNNQYIRVEFQTTSWDLSTMASFSSAPMTKSFTFAQPPDLENLT